MSKHRQLRYNVLSDHSLILSPCRLVSCNRARIINAESISYKESASFFALLPLWLLRRLNTSIYRQFSTLIGPYKPIIVIILSIVTARFFTVYFNGQLIIGSNGVPVFTLVIMIKHFLPTAVNRAACLIAEIIKNLGLYRKDLSQVWSTTCEI